MGFKKKLVGFVAAAALTLSMGAGIASAQTGTGTAWLDEGHCKLTLTNSSIYFGDWVWDGFDYQAPEDGSNEGTVGFKLTTPKDKKCDVTASTSGLSNGDSTIDPDNFKFGSGTPDHLGKGEIGPISLPNTNRDIIIELESVPDDMTPGWYEGTVEFTVSPS